MTKRELILQFIRDFFRSKTPIEIAEHELLEAQLAQMDAETSVEYYVAMVQYNQKRIDRLKDRLKDMYDRKEAIAQPDIRMDWNQRIDTIKPGPIERIPTSGQGQTKI
jgi:hypothetical protein